jgi:lysophospholipase L1-like esterase
MTVRSRRRLAAAIVLGAGIVIAAIAAEAIVRLAAPQTLSLPWPVVHGVRIGEPNARGHVAVPGQFDIAVRLNSQGFRSDHDFTFAPAPDQTRIAVLGDSFVFGWGVEERQSFPAQLETVLRANGHSVEVINAGVPGQSLGEKAIWYRDAVARFHPHIVVLEVLIDDVDAENGVRAFELRDGVAVPALPSVVGNRSARSRWYSIPLYGWLSEHSQATALLKRALAGLLRRNEPRHAANPLHWSSPVNRAAFLVESLPLLAAEVVWLSDEVTRNGGRLVVVALPLREMIYGGAMAREIDDRYSAISARLSEICKARRDVRFVDLRVDVQAAAANSVRELYYKGNETHPNALGYRAFAIALASRLSADDFVQRRSFYSIRTA